MIYEGTEPEIAMMVDFRGEMSGGVGWLPDRRWQSNSELGNSEFNSKGIRNWGIVNQWFVT